MTAHRLLLLLLLISLGSPLAICPARALQNNTPGGKLPPELRGEKVYHLDLEKKPAWNPEKLVLIKDVSYGDITFQRLMLNVSVSITPVDHAATIQRIYFQDVRVNSLPVHLETLEREFQLSRKQAVDLPAPLKCSIVFADLDSLKPVSETLAKKAIQITGEGFVEVKLNGMERLAMRARHLVIPLALDQQVPLHLYSGNLLLRLAADKILDTLTDPSTPAALALARDRLSRLVRQTTLSATTRPALFLVYCEYAFADPKTQSVEKFSQAGTGFVFGAEGRLLTAKRVVEPWKFDPQIAFLAARNHLEFDPDRYRLYAWPAGARVNLPDGRLDFDAAASSEKATLQLLKIAPDRFRKEEYQDPSTGERATLELEAEGDNDLAWLQLAGAHLAPLAVADNADRSSEANQPILFGFPFGLNQPRADPRPVEVQATLENGAVRLDHLLNPGESGAPLLTAEGKVIAIASGANYCIPIEAARQLVVP